MIQKVTEALADKACARADKKMETLTREQVTDAHVLKTAI